MAAAAPKYKTNNAHDATIDAVEYECTDLDINDGGSTEDVSAGDDGGFGRDEVTQRRVRVSGTFLIAAAGGTAFEALKQYACVFNKATGVKATGDFLCTERTFAGATASVLKVRATFVSQGTCTVDSTGVAA